MTAARAIAIVGLGGRFPGAPSPDALWELVAAGRSAVREVPAGRWPVVPERVVDAAGGVDRARSQRAAFLEPFELDVPGVDVDRSRLTPLTKLVLQVAADALGSTLGSVDRSKMGAIVANIALPTDGASLWAEQVLMPHVLEGARVVGDPHEAFPTSAPIGEVARLLGLGKGAWTLDAACASSLYAIHLACLELESGRAAAMLAGGVSLAQSLYTQIGFTQLQALSPTGVCAPFSSSADGLVVGEGAGLVVLKRLEDARRDGDRVLGVIRGIGLSNDVGGSLLSPDSEGQLRAMRAAYAEAGWRPSSVQLVECHGTGTPRGDHVELSSLATLFDGARPVIGSVKSNVGHLLTAAGIAGLTKVLKAFERGTLAPTANVRSPAPAAAPFELLHEPRAWKTDGPRRAAVSGFGFGGINAHLLIEAGDLGGEAPRVEVSEEPIAIIGVGARIGSLDGVEAISAALVDGDLGLRPRPARRWRVPDLDALQGAWIEALELPIGRFKVPPLELPSVLPQQLLMLQVAAEAVERAGGLGDAPRVRTGAVVGIALDLETTSFHVRWVLERHARAALVRAGLDVNEAELAAWLERASALVSAPLDAQRVLGALGGIVTSRLARELSLGGPSFGVQAEEASGLRALEVAARLLQRRDVDCMVVGAVDLAGDVRRVVAARRLGEARPPAEAGVALVVKRLSDAHRDGDRVLAVVRDVEAQLDRAAVEAGRFGDAGAASGLVALLVETLAIHHRVLPGARATPWASEGGPRRRTVRQPSMDGTTVSVSLEQAPNDRPRAIREGRRPAGLFLVSSGSVEALRTLAREQATTSIDRLAAEWFQRTGPQGGASAIVAASVAQLTERLSKPLPALRTIEGELAFVFPGSGSHYDGMGESLPLSFPLALEQLGREVKDFSRHLFPRMTPGPAGLADLIVKQVTHGLVTHDALSLLGVKAQAYLGYSLGESAALFASRTWRDRDVMFSRTLESALFRSELTSDGSIVRNAFGPDAEWAVALVMRPKSEVQAQLTGTAALLIVNAPSECVIGGRRDDVRAVVGRLGGAAVFLEGVPFVHLPAIEPVKDAYRALHVLPTTPRPDVRIYSCGWARAYEPTEARCADSVLANAMHGFDFTALIEQAWRDGVRVFVEPGPQGSCTRMIGRILGERPHVAVAACQRGQDGYVSLLEAVAQVANTGRPVDLAPLYAETPGVARPRWTKTVRIELGGAPLQPLPLPGASAPRSTASVGATGLRDSRTDGARPLTASAHQSDAPGASASQLMRMTTFAPGRTVNGDAAHSSEITLAGQGLAMRSTVSGPSESTINGGAHQVDSAPVATQLTGFLAVNEATAKAHARFLEASRQSIALQTQILALQRAALHGGAPVVEVPPGHGAELSEFVAPLPPQPLAAERREVAPRFDRALCLEFAIGKLAKVLGPQFAAVDAFPTRVRLPDEPLMLVDRIVDVEGEPGSLTSGRCITEHDVHPGAWYLDGGRVPVCISVEAGQADLFLSAYLGIDLQTKGERVYRLLDAKVLFHRDLPRAGEVIRYDIRIDRFVRQGDTWLFFFRFDGTIDGEPFITMFDGCAGFFSREQLDQGKGIVAESRKARPSRASRLGADFTPFTPLTPHGRATLNEAQVEALRSGALDVAFGRTFPIRSLSPALRLPSGRMHLVDRILELDTEGGAARLGLVIGEHDVSPDAWYLTCHFSDDPVMPGTLMYECCLHTLRVLLLRLGWIDDATDVDLHYAPVEGQASQLKCRGQVLQSTKRVQYRVEIDEIGYGPEPYVIATASMFADGKHVVQMDGMSVRIRGLTRERLEALWGPPSAQAPVFSREQIIEYCEGQPSKCFGPAYAPFDHGGRRLARLPRDPFRFIDRVTACDAKPLVMEPGGWLTCQYDVPPEAWYFSANRQRAMPFSVLLEAALQPCGFLAAHVGSALTTPDTLSFRNLDGSATVLREVRSDVGTLTMRARLTKVSRAGGMLLQSFDFEVLDRDGPVYRGDTGFGFFPPAALAQQVGIRGGAAWPLAAGRSFGLPMEPPLGPGDATSRKGAGLQLPARAYAMIETIDSLSLEGGAHGLGSVGGSKRVDPAEWFFAAHFFQDPVMPGSLGLEALQQLLLVYARERFPALHATHRLQSMAVGQPHVWQYRGQVVPSNALVQVQAQVKQLVDGAEPLIVADGQLLCDGKVIYAMKDFAVRLVQEGR
ncbi:MAG: beta-ketoacyl synthase N-terminal-like domain-containing protein [Myxococcaceae bacterium]|nr:beta-ketoacyl synthase N-terminal-like domain-containing protein [Myxococcaceae bacterium]